MVLFDIGSGSVGGALVTIESDNTPTLHFSVRTPIPFLREPAFEILAREMLKALRITANEIAQHISKTVRGKSKEHITDQVHCVYSSDWYVAKTHQLVEAKKEPFSVNRKLIHAHLKKTEEAFRESVTKGDSKVAGDLVDVEQHVIQTILNGYPTENPYGKRVTRFGMSVYTSLISQTVQSYVQTTLKEVLHSREVRSHTFLLAYFLAVKD